MNVTFTWRVDLTFYYLKGRVYSPLTSLLTKRGFDVEDSDTEELFTEILTCGTEEWTMSSLTEVRELIDEHNNCYETNYGSIQEFNDGEEYYKIEVNVPDYYGLDWLS